MASWRPATDAADLEQLREQVADLWAIIEEQQQQAERQQEEIVALRARLDEVETVEVVEMGGPATCTSAQIERGHATSRRRLLAGAGVAAAAATMALVASGSEAAHAAPTTDGNNLQLGSGGDTNNSASTTTTLSAVSSSSPGTLLKVDASSSMALAPIALQGICNAASGTGVSGTSTGTNGTGVYGNGTSNGVYGNSAGGVGVYGYISGGGGGFGVRGISDNGIGTQGGSTGGIGVEGGTSSGTGVWGHSVSSYGVVAESTTNVDLYASGTGCIRQFLQASTGAPTSGTYSAGEMIRDHNGELWLCIHDGTPGTWVMAAHAIAGYTGGATTYISKPIRLLDTRSGSTDALTNGGGPYTALGSPYPVAIAGVSFNGVMVPSSYAGAIGNVTVVAGGGGGYLALVPHGRASRARPTWPLARIRS